MTEAELDRIASGIRPSWELDDAPFRPAGFASPELDALLNGNGAHAVHTNGAAAAIVAQPIVAVAVPQVEARPAIDLVEAPIAPAPKPVAPAPKPAAPPPTPAARAKNGVVVPPAAQSDPFAVPSSKGRTSSSEIVALKKSRSGLWVALGGGVVAVGIAIYLFTGSSSKTEKVKQEPSAQQIAASAAKTEIPPPPATDEIPQPTAKATSAPTVADTSADTTPAPTATTPPQATQTTHASHNAEPPAPHHTTTSHPSNPPPSGGGGKKGGIVRDVPF